MVTFTASLEHALVENAKRFVASLPDELDKEMDLYIFAANMSACWTRHRVRTSFHASTFADLKEQMETFIKNSDEGKADNEIAKVALKSATSGPDVSSEGTTPQPTVVMVYPWTRFAMGRMGKRTLQDRESFQGCGGCYRC